MRGRRRRRVRERGHHRQRGRRGRARPNRLGHDRLDAVVCTPAINVRKKIVDYTDDEFDRVVRVNLKGTFNVVRAAGRIMMPCKAGSIVVFSSIRSQVVEPGQSVYAMTKAGVVQLVRTAAAEFGPSGIRVNAIGPGVVETPLTAPIMARPEWYRAYANKSVFKRWASLGGDGRADVVPAFGRGQLCDRNHPLRRRRLARRRRPLHTAGDVTAVSYQLHLDYHLKADYRAL